MYLYRPSSPDTAGTCRVAPPEHRNGHDRPEGEEEGGRGEGREGKEGGEGERRGGRERREGRERGGEGERRGGRRVGEGGGEGGKGYIDKRTHRIISGSVAHSKVEGCGLALGARSCHQLISWSIVQQLMVGKHIIVTQTQTVMYMSWYM